MISPFYNYYHIKTDCISNTWETVRIENYIIQITEKIKFENKENGYFISSNPFISLQLMLVKDYDSWNSNDYNVKQTNYIDIVTGKDNELLINEFLRNLSLLLGWDIIEENED